MATENEIERPGADTRIEMPSPTAWPLVLALGLALSISGMVTSAWVTLVGVLMFVYAASGWFREILPHEAHEWMEVTGERVEITRSKREVARLSGSSTHQQVQPVETFSLLAGIEGGVAGGIAMLVPAVIYGLLKEHSVWYPVNLLAAGGFPSWSNESNAFLAQFHWKGLIAASIIHGVTCPLVGLLYAAVLPMFPKRPILMAGFVVPLFWTSLIYSMLGLISPILNQRIDWDYFIPSQLAFGLVTGWVINRHIHLRGTDFSSLPFAVRAGLHSDVRNRDDADGGHS
ncbi:hypothetical protein [Granulicella tundricola]|uniref:Uncharacterized protein n=1 Tax=Granulicella tundricola (strain ATCC BAA-1859 / DSM 23138 / MP5ACTX9) TaxID=1198114 RepID=E8X2I1_GRATM|nr:hypothetical protein [Granulicella tundricola]ADW69205.1 hypothetical protein AciX9_2161 [Granulicella tundricola MP5ACTX9]